MLAATTAHASVSFLPSPPGHTGITPNLVHSSLLWAETGLFMPIPA